MNRWKIPKPKMMGEHTDNNCGGEVWYTSIAFGGILHCKKCRMSSHDFANLQAPNYGPIGHRHQYVDERKGTTNDSNNG